MKYFKLFYEFNTEVKFNMDEFKLIKSFKSRINYCNKFLKKLSAGSSRIVYQFNSNSVLKLAKNNKGLQQNLSEGNEYNNNYFNEIRTNVFDYDVHNDMWIISEMAKKITPSIFKLYTNIEFRKLGYYVNLKYAENNGKKITNNNWLSFMSLEEKNQMDNNKFVSKILEFMLNNGLGAGDISRISSWGIVNREGNEIVVLVDYGYTGYNESRNNTLEFKVNESVEKEGKIIIIGAGGAYDYQIQWIIDYLKKYPKYQWVISDIENNNIDVYDMREPKLRHKGDAVDAIDINTKAVIGCHLYGKSKSEDLDYFYNIKNDQIYPLCKKYNIPFLCFGDNPVNDKREFQIFD